MHPVPVPPRGSCEFRLESGNHAQPRVVASSLNWLLMGHVMGAHQDKNKAGRVGASFPNYLWGDILLCSLHERRWVKAKSSVHKKLEKKPNTPIEHAGKTLTCDKLSRANTTFSPPHLSTHHHPPTCLLEGPGGPLCHGQPRFPSYPCHTRLFCESTT